MSLNSGLVFTPNFDHITRAGGLDSDMQVRVTEPDPSSRTGLLTLAMRTEGLSIGKYFVKYVKIYFQLTKHIQLGNCFIFTTWIGGMVH